jgi:hypothetical protein
MPQYDVFISHASEDKADVARPLAELLQRAGLSVWLDEFELRIGDSLREKIDLGLSQSRFGVVVLSHNFFAKQWTKRELNALFAIEVDTEKVILPVWHQVQKYDVRQFSPILADRLAADTSQGLASVARGIATVVQKKGITAALANLIEVGPKPDELADFLVLWPSILADCIDQRGVCGEGPYFATNPQLPPFNLVSSVLRSTAGHIDWRCMLFLPSAPTTDDDGQLPHHLQQCAAAIRDANNDSHASATLLEPRESDREDFGIHYFSANVFYGRRDEITDTAKQYIRKFMETRELQIMSYDRLLESSVRSGYDDPE